MRRSFGYSLLLHIALVVFVAVDWGLWSHTRREIAPPAPLMIDLNKVQIASKTNLPPLVNQKKQPKVQPVPEKKPEVKKAEPKKAPPKVQPKPQPQPKQPQPEAIKPAPVPENKQAAQAVAPVAPVAPAPTPEATKTSASALDDLLASVEKIKKTPQPKLPPQPLTGMEVNKGIEGGTGGSLTQVLSVSEMDFVSSRLRGCWHVDAGREGIEKMIVEIKAFVSPDGRVIDVKMAHHYSGPLLTIAESAVRAVYICDNLGDESPFKILADKYPNRYQDWRELNLRFNPLEDGVF